MIRLVDQTSPGITRRAAYSHQPGYLRGFLTHLLNAPMDEESRITSLHPINDPFFPFLITNIVRPFREGDRDRVRGQSGNCSTQRDGRRGHGSDHREGYRR